jgi:outer membrane protein assembly factor BamB
LEADGLSTTVAGLSLSDGHPLWSQLIDGQVPWGAVVGDVAMISASIVRRGFASVEQPGRVLAFDRSTGASRWTIEIPIGTSPPPYVVPTGAGAAMLLGGLHAPNIRAIDPVTGSLRWSGQVGGGPIGFFPFYGLGGNVLAANETNEASANGVTAVVLDLDDGHQRWRAPRREAFGTSGRYVYTDVLDAHPRRTGCGD